MYINKVNLIRKGICMKGIKYLLFGLMFILIGGFILIDINSSFGGFGEVILFGTGIGFGIRGLTIKEV